MTSRGDYRLIMMNPVALTPKFEPEINITDGPVTGPVSPVDESFFFHADIFYDFKSDYWSWNSTNTQVEAMD